MSAKLNKYRLRNIINDMRLEMCKILYRTLEGYAFKIMRQLTISPTGYWIGRHTTQKQSMLLMTF